MHVFAVYINLDEYACAHVYMFPSLSLHKIKMKLGRRDSSPEQLTKANYLRLHFWCIWLGIGLKQQSAHLSPDSRQQKLIPRSCRHFPFVEVCIQLLEMIGRLAVLLSLGPQLIGSTDSFVYLAFNFKSMKEYERKNHDIFCVTNLELQCAEVLEPTPYNSQIIYS